MTYELRLSPRAAAEIEVARDWWLDNRPSARSAFDEDVERAFALVLSWPDAGQPVDDPQVRGLRRVFLPKVGYHLYYRPREGVVEVMALWHASRGMGPDL